MALPNVLAQAYCYDTKPQRRIFEVLKSEGMLRNQQVTFLSDGDEKLRELVFGLNPNTEYLQGLVSHHYADNGDESNRQRTNQKRLRNT